MKQKRTSRKNKCSKNQTKLIASHRQEINDHGNHKPVWRLEIVDTEHSEWGWKKLTSKQTFSILERLKHYESMAWKDIISDKKRNHSVPIKKLSPDAIKHLSKLKLDDYPSLYRLRFNSKQRMWGIKEGFIFKILWWDEDHTVCPCEKKHT